MQNTKYLQDSFNQPVIFASGIQSQLKSWYIHQWAYVDEANGHNSLEHKGINFKNVGMS